MAVVARRRSTPDGTDRYGDPVAVDVVDTVIDGAFVAPRESSDLTDRGRAGVIVGLTLYAPFGTDLTHLDQVVVDGVPYDVNGEVGPWEHPFTGWKAGITAALNRSQG